jgi:hypothetical protein
MIDKVCFGLLCFLTLGDLAWAQSPRSLSVADKKQLQPVDPGVPIGCLLSEGCAPNLFIHPDGKTVGTQAPVDPSKGLPCLVNPHCAGSLGNGQREDLFRRAISPDDVIQHGARAGDFIPLQSRRAVAPRLPLGGQDGSAVAHCTASIMATKEAAQKAQNLTNSNSGSRRAAIDAVVSTHRTAIEACEDLNR